MAAGSANAERLYKKSGAWVPEAVGVARESALVERLSLLEFLKLRRAFKQKLKFERETSEAEKKQSLL